MATRRLPVTPENFIQAETARMFDSILLKAREVNRWTHRRKLTSSTNQNVIRMNRDTLYSGAVVDASCGFSIYMPDPADRYMSAAVINEDHYVEHVLHGPGVHNFSPGDCGTQHVAIILRTFIDPSDSTDARKAHVLQDKSKIEATSRRPFKHATFDRASRQRLANQLQQEANNLLNTNRMFGTKTEVDPHRHLVGTATGWGGLPASEAHYVFDTKPRPSGRYTVELGNVPVNGFWSFTVYNSAGYLEETVEGTAHKNSVTVQPPHKLMLTPEVENGSNHIQVMEGWNYVIRLYQPSPEILDGTWVAPTPQPA